MIIRKAYKNIAYVLDTNGGIYVSDIDSLYNNINK